MSNDDKYFVFLIYRTIDEELDFFFLAKIFRDFRVLFWEDFKMMLVFLADTLDGVKEKNYVLIKEIIIF